MSPRPASLALAAALVLVTALAFGLRLWHARTNVLVPDEEILTGLAEPIFQPGAPWPRHGGDHPALGIYLLAGSAAAFGRDLHGYRTLNVFFGTAATLLTATAVARSASRAEALLAALLLAVDPLHVWLSSLATQFAPQVAFVSAAWLCLAGLPGGGRRALVGASGFLGLAFLCNESAALVGFAWAIVLWRRSALRAGLLGADYLWAAAVGLAVISPDIVYNFNAARPDYHYVNYLDHLSRMATPTVGLQGLGFFLRDAFNSWLGDRPGVWMDYRDEYVGHGILLGALLLAGWLHSLRKEGDPTGGLWSLPPLLFIAVVTFTRPAGGFELDPPNWTWPMTTIGLVAAATARLLVGAGRALIARA